MNAPARLGIFGAAVILVFGAAAAVGNAVGPVHDDVPASGSMGHGVDDAGGGFTGSTGGHGGSGTADGMDGMDGMDMAAPAAGGLAVAEGDLRLVVDEAIRPDAPDAPFTFRILGADQQPVTTFDPEQGGVALHLVVVDRDLSTFQHLHPSMAPDGTWTTPLTLAGPGVYRVFADVTVDGRPHTLGTDLFVPGPFEPEPLPVPATTAGADGYQVSLGSPPPVAGQEVELGFRVARDGAPVADLEPYLGAGGHLVGLRQGDLAYLHLHPEEGPGAGEIAFAGSFPSPGTYRLFLQFQHEGVVRTAAFTVEVPR
ncbi:MAG: FixH family protein [Actinomycetota bacterium]|nr:FixH family protein [Actinomycetota bacterium]